MQKHSKKQLFPTFPLFTLFHHSLLSHPSSFLLTPLFSLCSGLTRRPHSLFHIHTCSPLLLPSLLVVYALSLALFLFSHPSCLPSSFLDVSVAHPLVLPINHSSILSKQQPQPQQPRQPQATTTPSSTGTGSLPPNIYIKRLVY